MRLLIIFLLASLGTYGQKSYSLEECIALAQQQHPDVLLQNLNIARAENTLRQSVKSRIPVVSGSVSTGLNGGRSIDPFSNSFVQRTISYNSFGMSAGGSLFNGFSLHNQVERNRRNKEAEQIQLETVRKEIKIAVIESYANVVVSRKLIRLQEESVQDLTTQAEAIQERVKEGVMASYSLTETQAQLATARFELVSAENNYRLAKSALAQLMMIKEDFEVDIPEIPSSVLVPETHGIHPALQVWDLRIRAAEYGVALARAEKYPRLSLNLGLGTSYSSAAIGEFSYTKQLSHNFNQFASLGLSIPLFSNGLINARMDAARMEEKITRKQREKTEIQLSQQAETLKLEVAFLEEKLKSATVNTQAQALLYESAKEKFKEGLVNQLELNTYRLNREKSQVQFIQTQYELYFRNEVLKEFLD